MRKIQLFFCAALLIMAPLQGCRTQSKAVRKAEARQKSLEKQRKAEDAAAYESALKRHRNLQSKETRKRMKETAKKSRKMQPARKPTLWERIRGKK